MATQKQRTQAEWSQRNPTYWTERQLAKQMEQAKEVKQAKQAKRAKREGVLRGPPAAMTRTPVEMAQDAIGIEGLVIIAFIARMLHRDTQEAMRRQLSEIQGEIRAIHPIGAQDVIAPGGADP